MRAKNKLRQRNAFTLIEVMVAAILISVVGLSLLQMHQNSADMSYKMQGEFQHSDWVLMAVNESPLEEVKKRTRFDTLMKSFNIDKRPIREGLNKKVEVGADLVQRINASDMSKEVAEESGETKPLFEGFRLEVYKQNIQIEDETYSVYRMIKP